MSLLSSGERLQTTWLVWSSELFVWTITHATVGGGLEAVANCSISLTLASSVQKDHDDRDDVLVRCDDRDDLLVEASDDLFVEAEEADAWRVVPERSFETKDRLNILATPRYRRRKSSRIALERVLQLKSVEFRLLTHVIVSSEGALEVQKDFDKRQAAYRNGTPYEACTELSATLTSVEERS